MWKESFRTGIDVIDRQHKELFEKTAILLRGANDSVENNRELCISTIRFLENYAVSHFTYEEDYLLSIDYPDFAEHKMQHDKFLQSVVSYEQKMEESDFSAKHVKEFTGMLATWLIYHVADIDLRYAKPPKYSGGKDSRASAPTATAAATTTAASSATASAASATATSATASAASATATSASASAAPAPASAASAHATSAASDTASAASAPATSASAAAAARNHGEMVRDGIISTLNMMAGLEEQSFKDADLFDAGGDGAVSVDVGITGAASGYMTFVYPVPFIKNLMTSLMNYTPSEIGEMEISALFELTNIIGGNICGQIQKNENRRCDVMPPSLSDISIDEPDERICLETGIGVIKTDLVVDYLAA